MVADTLGGGLGAAISCGSAHLTGAGWDVTILAPDDPSAVGLDVHGDHHTIALPRSSRSVGAMRSAARQVRQAVAELRPTIVHCHGMRSFWATRVLGRCRAHLTLHGSGAAADDPPGYHQLRVAGLRALPRLAEVAYSAVPGLPAPWVFAPHVSPRIAGLDVLPPAPTGAPVLWLGRLDDPKLPHQLADGLLLAGREAAVHGLVAGSGPLEAALRAHIARTGAPLELLGHRGDVDDLLQRCSAVVLLSRFEAVPFAVTEAMWAGRAVIASDLPGTRWLAGDRPHGVSLVRGVDDLAAALIRLADPDTAAEDGRRAAARVRALVTPGSPWPQIEADYRRRAGR